MSNDLIKLDVREDIRTHGNPFAKIMDAVVHLSEDQNLMVIAPFEPAPLITVLRRQGFSHHSNQLSSGDWEVTFSRATEPTEQRPQGPVAPEHKKPSETNGSLAVDARGLEPPQPMVRILEALSTLPPDSVLHARTDRRPLHLYAQLEARGFKGETEEQADGGFITHIRHN